MPFYNYKINNKLINNIQNINQENLESFYHTMEILNYRGKAIFINNIEQDLKKKLFKKITEISNQNLDLNAQKTKELLTKLFSEIDKSILCNLSSKEIENVIIDFDKDHLNKPDPEKKSIVIEGDYFPHHFENKVTNFVKEFLNKIKLFAYVKYVKKEKIEKIYIYHKELAKYLFPEEKSLSLNSIDEYLDDLKRDVDHKGYISRYSQNNISSINKIKNGSDVLVKWWISIPKKYRPTLKILSDIPPILKELQRKKKIKIQTKELKFLEEKISMFFDFQGERPDVELIWQSDMPGNLWWQHKRHWIFVPKFEKNDKGEVKDFDFLAIKHDYGVEFVDEINKLQLRRDMELKVINDKRIHHMKDIKNHLILEEKLILEKN